MFRFLSSRKSEASEQRRKKQEVWKSMRRLVDRHAAKELLISDDNRREPRHAISIPVLIQSFDADSHGSPEILISKNISEDGIALLSKVEMNQEHLFCAVWEDKPLCFVGMIRQSRYVGGGYWELGVEFQEMTTLYDWESLRELAQFLDPAAC
jgi:hypothetical protein